MLLTPIQDPRDLASLFLGRGVSATRLIGRNDDLHSREWAES